jgi:protein-S-isoprenylcysteine O-methyltransferase Ste14
MYGVPLLIFGFYQFTINITRKLFNETITSYFFHLNMSICSKFCTFFFGMSMLIGGMLICLGYEIWKGKGELVKSGLYKYVRHPNILEYF